MKVVLADSMTTTTQPISRFEVWIALLGIAASLMAYAVREFLIRMHVSEVTVWTNLA